MRSYTFTELLGSQVTVRDEGKIVMRSHETGRDITSGGIMVLGHELLRVVEENARERGLIEQGLAREHRLEARIAALEAEVERLKGLEWSARQNLTATAGLQSELEDMRAAASLPNPYIEALEAENARLRQRVTTDMLDAIQAERAAALAYLRNGLSTRLGRDESLTNRWLLAQLRDIEDGRHLDPRPEKL